MLRGMWRLALVVVLLHAASASAGVVPLARVSGGGLVALTPDSAVVASGGRLVVVPVGGGPERLLLRAPADRGIEHLAAGPGLVAVSLVRGPENLPDAIVLAGPPEGPLRTLAHYRRGGAALLLGLQVDAGHVVLRELRRGPTSRVRIFEGDRELEVATPERLYPTDVSGDVLAGYDLSGTDALVAFDWRSGAERLRVTPKDAVDLLEVGPGGSLVYDDGDIQLAGPLPDERRTVLSDPRHRFELAGVEGDQAILHGAAGRAKALFTTPLAGGGDPIRITPVSDAIRIPEDEPGLGYDDGRIAYVAGRCAIVVTPGPAPDVLPPGPCPRSEVSLLGGPPGPFPILGRRRSIVEWVTCVAAPPPGCRGTIGTVVRGSRARFLVAPGARRRVRIRLSERALRGIRRQWRAEHGRAFLELRAVVRDPAGRSDSQIVNTTLYRDARARRRGL